MYVDKTALIRQFYECDQDVIGITFPRRFGKTIGLEMIKEFFKIEVDENGKQIPRKIEDSVLKDSLLTFNSKNSKVFQENMIYHHK